MSWNRHGSPQYGGSAPATPGFNAVAPEWLFNYGAADAAPAIPAAESTLGSHPCVALSSAQVLPEWINRNLVGNRFAANGDNPLNFVSHSRGSLQQFNAQRNRGEVMSLIKLLGPPDHSAEEQQALIDFVLALRNFLLLWTGGYLKRQPCKTVEGVRGK